MKLIRSFFAEVAAVFTDMWTDGIVGKIIATLIAACLLFVCAIPYLMYADGKDYDAWAAWCAEQGDTHIDKSTSTGVMPAGKTVVVTSDTTYYCLSSDGRLLDVRD
jgi:hypothetical protein